MHPDGAYAENAFFTVCCGNSCRRTSAAELMAVSRLDAIPEDPSRYRDDPDSDDERKHRSVDRRMNMEKRAGCGANDQRDKHTAQSAVLFAG